MTESYTLTLYGLLAMEIGEDAARKATERIELHLRRHHGTPSGVVLTPDGEFIFTSLEQEPIMTTKTDELKACPCCGGEAAFNTTRTTCRETIKLNKRDTGYGVNCVVCGINNRGLVLGYESKALAAEAWNRRAALQSQDREDAQDIAATLATALHFIPKQKEPELYADMELLCARFSGHARRIEGEQ